jgi:hypothetical protein
MTKHLVIGASVPRYATPAIRAELPNVTIDAMDGRSWIDRDIKGGNTLWEAFWKNYRKLGAGDWLIVEMSAGWLTADTNRNYLRQVIKLLDDTIRLAVIQPHTYYNAETPDMQTWNREMDVMQRELIVTQPDSVQVWWSGRVRQFVALTTQTPEQAALGAPLLSDGRHPTPRGQIEYARLIKYCIDHA